MRSIAGIDIEVAREDGTVWGRVSPGSGWRDLGSVRKEGNRWVAKTPTLTAWRYHGAPLSLSFDQVQTSRSVLFDRQRDGVEFVVSEYLAARPHS